ncbi:MAG: Hsp20/alpha crystallin family protein [Chloroflexi bacterium]|nr:MAG: Hsp20/alpha crystallin family protein [Chloroflexota bacterium]
MECGMSPAKRSARFIRTGGAGKMALSRWSPMGELAGLHTAMDRLFSDFFGGPLLESGETSPRSWYLPIDVVDKGEAYEVRAAVPGFSPEEVELTYSDGMLNISAQHKQESSSKRGSYLRRELTYGSFARSVQLPGDVKEDQIKASFENGILVIEIPKVPAAQPRKIAISGKSQKQLVGVGSQS